MKYFVNIGGTEQLVELDGAHVTVGGSGGKESCHVEAIEGTPVVVLTIGNAVHRLVVRRTGQGSYVLDLDGFRLEAEALDERRKAIRALAGPAAAGHGPRNLIAPMPGLVVRVAVSVGDVVQAGQGAVTMEAMKMENELRAPSAGKVKRVLVEPGNAVEKGAVLLEME